MASFTPLVQPQLVSLEPAHSQHSDLKPHIYIRHPGYRTANNVLLNLPAVDPIDPDQPPAQRTFGLHHRTALTAGALIANNAFDQAYFTHDQAGQRPVVVPLDDILQPGEYWLQLKGKEPPSAWFAPFPDNHSSMPPPPPSTSGFTPKYEPYPIVPTFRDWSFPHQQLPAEWTSPIEPFNASPSSHTNRSQRCYLTNFRMGYNRCHLVPSVQSEWFDINGMAMYASTGISTINDEANIMKLRADIHLLFDQHRFVFVPKPSTASHTSLAYAFAAHALITDEETGEFPELFQNKAIYSKGISRQYLFARFALALFPFLRPFLSSSTRRRLAVMNQNQQGDDMEAQHQEVWMTHAEYIAHLDQRGESLSGSRKRQYSRTRQDEADDDAFEERWSRRSASLDNRNPHEKYLDEADSWYAETMGHRITYDVGWSRQRSVDHHDDAHKRYLDEADLWYKETLGHLVDKDTINDDEDQLRGRSRHREYAAPTLALFRAGSDTDQDVPNLSRSFTTSSNRSSWIDFPEDGDGDRGKGTRGSTVSGKNTTGWNGAEGAES